MSRTKKQDKGKIKNAKMFSAMRDIFYGGEFAWWLEKQSLNMASCKEYEEALRYFEKETGFKVPGWGLDDGYDHD